MSIKENIEVLKFRIGALNIALPVSSLERVIWTVEIKPLPGSPALTQGVINLNGQVIPIINFRKKLSLRSKQPALSDRIVIAKTSAMTFGFICDEVYDVLEITIPDITSPEAVLPGKKDVLEGIVIVEGDIIYIYDTLRFLSSKEEQQLQKALDRQQSKQEKRGTGKSAQIGTSKAVK